MVDCAFFGDTVTILISVIILLLVYEPVVRCSDINPFFQYGFIAKRFNLLRVAQTLFLIAPVLSINVLDLECSFKRRKFLGIIR